MATTLTTSLKWTRLAPGYYRAETPDFDRGEHWHSDKAGHQFEIIHRVIPDEGDGYGRRDDWILCHTGHAEDWDNRVRWENDYASDPYPTLRDAKAGAETMLRILEEVAS